METVTVEKTKQSRAAYMREYRRKRKDYCEKELERKRESRKKPGVLEKEVKSNKENREKKRVELLKAELEKTLASNQFYRDDRNIYFERMPCKYAPQYFAEKRKVFELRYDIEHLTINNKKREEAYSKFCRELDLKQRIEKYQVFRRQILKEEGREPDFTDMSCNSVCKPEGMENYEDYAELVFKSSPYTIKLYDPNEDSD